MKCQCYLLRYDRSRDGSRAARYADRSEVTMRHEEPEVLVNSRCEVGEGPLYDEATDALYWADIPRGLLWRHAIGSGITESCRVGESAGSLCLRADGGLVVAGRRGFLRLTHWGADPELWRPVEVDLPTQFNDGKCDRHGRFLAGTVAPKGECAGALYRLDIDGSVTRLIGGLGMSNGLDWSPDDRHFYHVDSLPGTVTRYVWNADDGVPHDPKPLITLSKSEGLPDGLVVDADGFLWLAVWGGAQVRRYDPAGRLLDIVSLPTPNIAGCTFGGTDLFVTTAATGIASDDKLAGAVFVIPGAARGQTRPTFGSTQ
jgi:L-arabinonolactonase